LKEEELQDYDEKELEKSEKLYYEAREKLRRKQKISPSQFFSELRLEDRIPYADWVIEVPIWVQIPYQKSLIVPIYPFATENKFVEATGVTPEEFTRLTKKGLIVPILYSPPLDYRNLDYLDPILTLKPNPPSPYRTLSFLNAVNNRVDLVIFNEDAINFASCLIPNFDGKHLEFLESRKFFCDSRKTLERDIRRSYYELCCLGYENLARQLEEALHKYPTKAENIFLSLHAYVSFLVYRFTAALDGTFTASRKVAGLWQMLGLKLAGSLDVFPGDVGRLITEKLLLAPVKNLGQAEDYYGDYDKCRHALKKLDEHISQREKYEWLSEEVLTRAQILEKTWNETTRSLRDWPIDERAMKTAIEEGVRLGTISLGVLGSVATRLPPEASLLAAIFSKYLGDFIKEKLREVIPQAAEFTVRLLRQSHMTAIMDVVSEWPPAQRELELNT